MAISGPSTLQATLKFITLVLKKGGLPTQIYTKSPNAIEHMAAVSALFPVFVLTLEASNWKLGALMDPTPSLIMAQSAEEVLTADKAARSDKTPLMFGATSIQLLVKLAGHFATIHGMQLFPMDLETFLQYHFTKVGDQMLDHMQEYIDLAKKEELPSTAMETLKQRVIEQRSQQQAEPQQVEQAQS